MSDILKFVIQKDYEWGEDGCYTTLFEEGNEVISGDYYHNHVDDLIDGFFIGLDYLGIKYEKEKISINIEESGEWYE